MLKTDKIYLDYNATSPLRPSALQSMLAAYNAPLNASSVHSFGREGRKLIEDARAALSAAINCPAPQITFNSGATEGNNTILAHFTSAYPDETILVSAIEHPSVHDLPIKNIDTIPVHSNGTIDLNALEQKLKNGGRTSLVSVMAANNETGAIQPIQEIAALAHSSGALFHCDATQLLSKQPIDMVETGIDALTLSAHKIGGPQGVGALAIGLCGINPILLHGGGQEKKQRAGTENVAGIAGFGAAITEACAPEKITSEAARLSGLQQYLEKRIIETSPDAYIFAQDQKRLPNTTQFGIAGMTAANIVMACDLENIAISNGSACSSGKVQYSHVLCAMQAQPSLAEAAIRISTGWTTSKEDIDKFLIVWEKIYKRHKQKLAK